MITEEHHKWITRNFDIANLTTAIFTICYGILEMNAIIQNSPRIRTSLLMLYAIINLGQIFYRRFGAPLSMRPTPPSPLTKQQRIFINILLLSAILIISMLFIMKL